MNTPSEQYFALMAHNGNTVLLVKIADHKIGLNLTGTLSKHPGQRGVWRLRTDAGSVWFNENTVVRVSGNDGATIEIN